MFPVSHFVTKKFTITRALLNNLDKNESEIDLFHLPWSGRDGAGWQPRQLIALFHSPRLYLALTWLGSGEGAGPTAEADETGYQKYSVAAHVTVS